MCINLIDYPVGSCFTASSRSQKSVVIVFVIVRASLNVKVINTKSMQQCPGLKSCQISRNSIFGCALFGLCEVYLHSSWFVKRFTSSCIPHNQQRPATLKKNTHQMKNEFKKSNRCHAITIFCTYDRFNSTLSLPSLVVTTIFFVAF